MSHATLNSHDFKLFSFKALFGVCDRVHVCNKVEYNNEVKNWNEYEKKITQIKGKYCNLIESTT